MELLKEISERDIGIEERKEVRYTVRKAARTVLFDKDNKVALLFVSKHNYHKIPGGGIRHDEDKEKALQREAMEETGCTIDVQDGLGVIKEYRGKLNIKQFSYCYIAHVKEKRRKPSFTEKEKSQGFRLTWVDLDEAARLLERDRPNNYEGRFIIKRDAIFLRKAKQVMRQEF